MLLNWEIAGRNVKLAKISLSLFVFVILSLQVYFITRITSDNPMIVSIDVKAIIAEFIKQQKTREKQGKKQLDIDQLSQLIENFSARLSHEINKKAKEDNLFFVPKQAFIAGSKDYTDIIKNQVLKGT